MIYFEKKDLKKDLSPEFQKKDAVIVLPLSDKDLEGVAGGHEETTVLQPNAAIGAVDR